MTCNPVMLLLDAIVSSERGDIVKSTIVNFYGCISSIALVIHHCVLKGFISFEFDLPILPST